MSKRIIPVVFLFCFLLFLISPVFAAKPTEKTLLEAWELVQKNDPKTILFEKLAENRYRFKTKRFPFDGELHVFSISIDEQEREKNKKHYWGMVEIELVGQPESFFKRYPYSYSKWRSDNSFYFDQETRKWVTSRKYLAKKRKEFDRPSRISSRYIFTLSYHIVLLLILIVIIYFVRKIWQSNKQRVQDSSAFYRETNGLLKEILAELKKR